MLPPFGGLQKGQEAPAFLEPPEGGEAGWGKARLDNTLELPDWPNERNAFPGGTGGEQTQGRGKVFLPPPPPPSKGPYLIWSQSRGTLTDQDGNLLGNGYSGKGTPGEKDAGRNNPDREGEENVGPIPRGNWRVVEITDENYRPDLARPIFKLEPDTETEARVNSMGRKPRSFLVHGDNAESDASEGCIILNYPTRSMLKKYKDKVIHVSE